MSICLQTKFWTPPSEKNKFGLTPLSSRFYRLHLPDSARSKRLRRHELPHPTWGKYWGYVRPYTYDHVSQATQRTLVFVFVVVLQAASFRSLLLSQNCWQSAYLQSSRDGRVYCAQSCSLVTQSFAVCRACSSATLRRLRSLSCKRQDRSVDARNLRQRHQNVARKKQ